MNKDIKIMCPGASWQAILAHCAKLTEIAEQEAEDNGEA